jgi:hypothetical protein
MSDHEDIAAWERDRNAMWADPGYSEWVSKMPLDIVIPGSDTVTLFGTR